MDNGSHYLYSTPVDDLRDALQERYERLGLERICGRLSQREEVEYIRLRAIFYPSLYPGSRPPFCPTAKKY